ncbi:Site-specific recombinase XerD [Micromonospora rhizosphaerae]|uniref:Site-specific recombinase XerD n=1 Tax=Micromonospora rhizosphaerae TaxID=568872 RepID=A0A1C6RU59_9ACTN|nr:site-specific integrase [Micromonospora rhizosphaerae]SCL20753.1 Site-specific recombinase XerD [Micromonospora rhizosphaerae]
MGAVIAFPAPEPEEPRRRRSKKRSNGQGSIYQRKDGRWAGAAYVLTADGTFKRVPVYGKSAEEVDAKLTEIKSRSNRGLPAEATGWTMASYADYWMEHVASPKLRPTTLVRYRSSVARYVVPAIGKRRLTALTPADVRLMLSKAAATRTAGRKGQPEDERPTVSPRTVQQVHAVLRAMLSQAVREELLARNVARLVQVPTPDREEIHPWTEAEARAFLASARAHRLHALFVVALALGLRRGELLGLRWSDLDLNAGQLRVWQTLQRVRGDGVVFGPPKSRRSRRVLTMPAVVVQALKRHRNVQEQERRLADGQWQETGLVFTTATGRHVEPRNLNTAFGRLIARAGVRLIRFHDLRHTCATLLLAAGVSPRVVMDILGHSQIAVTMNIYGHVMPAMQQEAAGHIDAALSEQEETGDDGDD